MFLLTEMRWFLGMVSLIAIGARAAGVSFKVAEVKPHFGCSSSDGQNNVRNYISGLVKENYGIIALIQTEFSVPQPSGYAAYGAACVYQHPDAAVVMYSEQDFDYIKGFVDTVHGGVSDMPFINGRAPTTGKACLGTASVDGERAYTGARLRHKSSNVEFCAISATLPHFGKPAGDFFRKELASTCGGLPVLFVMDTNADKTSMDDIGRSAIGGWGSCSDPGAHGSPTCCNDIKKGSPYARYTYDRTAMCNGGSVNSWAVNSQFVCNDDEEHKFTTSVVELPSTQSNASVIVYT